MKKLYIMLAAASMAALSMQAKELSFTVAGEPVTPGSTVAFKDIEVTDLDGIYDIYMDPTIMLTSDVAADNITVSAAAEGDFEIQLCAGGQCEMGNRVTKTGVTLEEDTPLNIRFEYIAYAEEVPTFATEIYAQYGDDESTRTSFTIVMGPDASGIQMIKNNASLRSVAGSIEYSFDQTSAVTIYNLSGVAVKSFSANGTGSIATSDLAAGIYTYSITAEGALPVTGKIYIR